MTTPRGYEIVKHDPHIDDFIIQDDNQVPMEELHDYWDVWRKKFDRFICLTESVEANLLVMPFRVYYGWPNAARHLMCDVNYLQMVHAIAEVPLPPMPRFYPTAKETRRSQKFREKIRAPLLMWAIDGSSVHKHWPWMHNAMAKIMVETDFHIVLVGNEISSILEQGWENEPRVIRMSGKWSIRQTLSFVEFCDMIIGPETGVLNAAGMLDIPKIVFLSHSSENNFAKYYKNMVALSPNSEDCSCYPCHKLIYGWKNCVRDDVGALCQTKISLDQFWEAFRFQVNKIGKAA
jgi:ADP-heptose:LPS heptosyltransferase